MKKRIILWAVLGWLSVMAVGTVVYKWPRKVEVRVDNVALLYTREGHDTVGEFQKDYTTVTVSLTRHRRLTAPDSYTGTITVGETEYTVVGRDTGGFLEKLRSKWKPAGAPYMELSATKFRQVETAPQEYVTESEAEVRMIADGKFTECIIMEFPESDSGKTNRYVYPAETEGDARKRYQTIQDSFFGVSVPEFFDAE